MRWSRARAAMTCSKWRTTPSMDIPPCCAGTPGWTTEEGLGRLKGGYCAVTVIVEAYWLSDAVDVGVWMRK